jgi:uncharacterized membrane protein
VLAYLKKVKEILRAIPNQLRPTESAKPDFLPISRRILLIILVTQLFMIVFIVLDIFVARQVLGFLFLTFIPGYLSLKVAKIKLPSLYTTLLFSAGTSIFFTMIVGLLLNSVLPILGIQKSLSPLNTMFAINFCVVAACIFLWTKCESPSPQPQFFARPKFSARQLPLAIVLVSVLIATLLGTEIACVANNSLVLMLLVILTSVLVFCTLSKRLIPPSAYPLVILVIAFFLLFHISLTSGFLVGYDVHLEAYFAQKTLINSFWVKSILNPYSGMLSITILPVIYAQFLNYDMMWVFKVVFPLIYLLVPVTLYFVFRKQTSSLVAFLGVFLLMSMDTFYVQMLGLAREMIGEFFLVLSLLLIVDKRIDLFYRRLLLVVFSIGIILSHYSIVYIFLLLALVAYSISSYFRQLRDKSPPLVTGKFVLAYAVVGVVWYLFIVPGASTSLADALNFMYSAIISNVSGPGLGGLMPVATSFARQFAQYLFYILQVFIVVGLIALILARRVSSFAPEYSAMAIAGLLILVASVVLPNFAASLNISRFYHIALLIIAPFCALGGLELGLFVESRIMIPSRKIGKTAIVYFRKIWTFAIVAMLVCFFLFQVGFVYQATGDIPTSVALSRNRDNWSVTMLSLDADPREISACQWISNYAANSPVVYSDQISRRYLSSYGLVATENWSELGPTAQYPAVRNSLFFFGSLSVNYGQVVGYSVSWNYTNFTLVFSSDNLVYSDGGSDIYCKSYP